MNPVRTLVFLGVVAGFSGLLLAACAWVEGGGFLSRETLELWSRALLLDHEGFLLQQGQSFYPPLPFLLTLAVQPFVPAGPPPPVLVSCLLGGLMAATWRADLRERGDVGRLASLAIVALLVLNPLFLRCVAEGPAQVLLVIGVWTVGRGFFSLRLSGSAHDMMRFALGLLILAFSHRYGMMLVLAAFPFASVAARPSLLTSSPHGYLVALFFPVAGAAFAYLFLGAVFSDGLVETLLSPPGRAGADQALQGWQAAAWRLCLALCVAPAVLGALAAARATARLALPMAATAATVVAAALLDLAYGYQPELALALAPMLTAAFVAIRYWPTKRGRTPAALALSLVGVFGGALTLGLSTAPGASAWRAAALSPAPVTLLAEVGEVAAFLRGRDDLMMDPQASPELVVALGGPPGVVTPGDPRFERALARGRPASAWVAVRAEGLPAGRPDAVARAFGAALGPESPTYELVLRQEDWRIYRRRTLPLMQMGGAT